MLMNANQLVRREMSTYGCVVIAVTAWLLSRTLEDRSSLNAASVSLFSSVGMGDDCGID